jgi:ribose transport system ATP-binding protein
MISELFPKIRFAPSDEVLKIEKLSTPKHTVIEASLSVRAGEIVGLAGLVGSGKSEVMRAAFGVGGISAGRVLLKGRDVTGA